MCHADTNMMLLVTELHIHCCNTGYPCRMMNNDSICRFLIKSFLKRNNRTTYPHIITDMEANNLSAICIGDQIQIGKSLFQRYVSNIGHPELMWMQWREILYQVGIAVIEVFTVGGVNTSFCFAYKQFIAGQQTEKTISANMNIVLSKRMAEALPISFLQPHLGCSFLMSSTC